VLSVENDADDFAIFYKSAAERVFLFALSVSGSVPDAEDVTQEAFCGAYKHWGSLAASDNSARLAYVFRAAHHQLVNLYRFRARVSKLAGNLSRRAAGAFVHVEEEALRSDAVRALQQLPPQQRAVAVLLWVEELSIAEIADVLELSDKTVRTHRDRALRKMVPIFSGDIAGPATEGATG
jgi:RNA polymerase sigma-70 factor, ECF subfamily